MKRDAGTKLGAISRQVSGLAQMIEDDSPCVDLLSCLADLKGALDGFSALVVSEHIEWCVFEGNGEVGSPKQLSPEERVEEVRAVLTRLLR